MKILHTISDMSIKNGGPSSCTYTLLKGLNSKGVNADLLTYQLAFGDKFPGDGTFYKTVKLKTGNKFLYSKDYFNYLVNHPEYDLYHINGLWQYPSHAAAKYAYDLHKPYIFATHGMLYPQALKISPLLKKTALCFFQKKDLNRATCLQATCNTEMLHLRNFGLKNPIAVVPNCLEINTLRPVRTMTNEIRRFGYVGRIDRIKNIDRLLFAWKNLGISSKSSELIIIGDGDSVYKDELQFFVKQNRLDNVSFLGFLKGEALSEAVRNLDFQVLPSKSENFGMVVPEALIYGVPVIASKGTPWEELNTYNCGWWVDNDIDTLTATLKKALDLSEDKRIAMGTRGVKLIKNNYSNEVVALKMKQLYEYILGGGEKPDFVYL